MKSVVELDINVPQVELAKFFADPANNPKWMDDIERIEPLSGNLGDPGSVYRLVPKHGKMVFIATVVSRELPTELRLSLEEPSVSVCITAEFAELAAQKTRLVSEETFRFKGVFSKIFGFMAGWAIKRAHRRQWNPSSALPKPERLRSAGAPSNALNYVDTRR